jgi:hypothetical protein
VPVGDRGRVRLLSSAGSVHLVADLAGWYAPRAAATFRPVDPVRLLDSRGRGAPPLRAGGQRDLRVRGAGGVPAGATAVALTVTAVGATASGHVTAYPGGGPAGAAPSTSSVNAASPTPVPNLVVVRVGSDGTVRLRVAGSPMHLLVDVAGFWSGDPAGHLFRPVTPRRVLDTRIRLGTAPTARTRVGPGQSVVMRAGSATSIPRSASAAVLNVTGVTASSSTDVRVYPATAATVPDVSHLNLTRGLTAADLVIAKLGAGQVRLRNNSGTVGLVVDAAGWFGPAG